ncbi:7,8-dihydro-6-hydroxymethylpterin dimethyltransferase [uncultured archaeon]|nr:7,8-dihydro-6-hydroxymethylpterin dimethyltransferase [uncultured archaeon]
MLNNEVSSSEKAGAIYFNKTKSLCPECLDVIDASVYEKKGQIMIEKTCKKHGTFNDIYWSNAEQFKRFSRYIHDGNGITNPNASNGNCPHSCGLCSSHKTTTILANIDITNRCNQNCPVCFSNASSSGYLYEPSLRQISAMMQMLRNQMPMPCPAIQFAGGEPTMRDDLIQIIEMAKGFGFKQIMIATNGVKLAGSLKFCRDLLESGLNTVYLQFDGVTEEPYRINRGYNALKTELGAIENCRTAGLKGVILVPTLVKGVNDSQVGDIINFGINNMDTVFGVNFQPVSFSGRIDMEKRIEKRITITDFMELVERQTDGAISAEDFYPVPSIVPISHLQIADYGFSEVEFTVHPHCGAGTYVVFEKGKMTPITRFIDVDGLLEDVDELASKKHKWLGRYLGRIIRMSSLYSKLPKYIDNEKAPESIDVKKLLSTLLLTGTGNVINGSDRNILFIGAMHFMDLYNMDLERTKRCGVHYATPDGRIIPFCTYNTIHRAEIERKFAVPMINIKAR